MSGSSGPMGRVWVGCCVALAVVGLAAACGNAVTTRVEGQTGLARQADGSVLALVDTCSSTVDQVVVSGGREGLPATVTNRVLGELRPSSPQSGRLQVALSSPAAPWSAPTRMVLPQGKGERIVLTASNRAADTEARQVSATVGELDALRPGEVLVGEGQAVSLEQFHATSCGSPS